ncbi:UDP-N-acetylglucosamine 2-epimerase [Candidatus Beckwithbacteria bacterium RBG_13_42_9]|uniref:UDP-N-acetylglucosamine 2-epimerase (non-hydrolyzing) n=1 Tax=Candidatus Beckwithbacteria bacterium RBG_13_42_9 TaxID=1797457 RepID=A0A1F5E7K8_9BACT|nr:MAG: UDP-N-acetylglucosamine 2-epimerase [Candidatus Beckwithbacteria bacterium RBG_13_42_9]
MKILTIFGTRPEAIKLSPVLDKLSSTPQVESFICTTGQHRDLLDEMLSFFKIVPAYDLNLMRYNQRPEDIIAASLTRLERVIQDVKPDWILVQGDTVTVLAASLAAFFKKIKLAHIEAGLRSYDKFSPFPEETNRRLVSHMTDLHFAPTLQAKKNLLAENIPEKNILVTGNTAIDNILNVCQKIKQKKLLVKKIQKKFPFLNKKRRLILATIHRRENFGKKLENVAKAFITITRKNHDSQIILPVHPNPNVRIPLTQFLQKSAIYLVQPLDYPSFIYLMDSAYLLMTDSGGIQEEATALGKPVLILRDVTERPEIVEARIGLLTGTNQSRIVKTALRLLNDQKTYQSIARKVNIFGDGLASQRIVSGLLGKKVKEFEPF